ncbi:hypothetical protein CF327_g7729, partial [Tilletia walkeri]
RLQQTQSAATALQQLQADLDEINERGFVGLADISRVSRAKGTSITHILGAFDNLSPKDDILSSTAAGGAASIPLSVTGRPADGGRISVSADFLSSFIISDDAEWLLHNVVSIMDWIASSQEDATLAELDIVHGTQLDRIMELSASPERYQSSAEAQKEAAGSTLHGLFERQVARRPKKIAVQFGTTHFMTYEDLDMKATHASRVLIANGVRAGDMIPLNIHKSPALIISMLATLKAGAAYVPMEPSHPWTRRERIVIQTACPLILVEDPSSDPFLDAAKAVMTVEDLLNASDVAVEDPGFGEIAILIFTSGTTGLPKGVMFGHDNACAYFTSRQGIARETAWGRRLNFPSVAFDVSAADTWSALTSGACLCLASSASLQSELGETLQGSCASSIFVTPSVGGLFRQQLESGADRYLQTIFVGGERFGSDTCRAMAQFCTVQAVYGPTETTIDCTQFEPANASSCHQLDAHQYVPIGWPHGRTRIYIVDTESTKLRPIGAVGEICVGGPQVTKGYLNDSVKTNAKYIENPYESGTILYRTGDLGRLHGNGLFECVGRADGQVKIRGLRIETGEVESGLLEIEAIKHARVLKMDLADGIDRLIAFVHVPTDEQGGKTLSSSAMNAELANIAWSHLETVVPAYMLPFLLVQVNFVPITPNGKIDDRQLRTLIETLSFEQQAKFSQIAMEGNGNRATQPENETQTKLRALWAKVLQLDEAAIGIDDS